MKDFLFYFKRILLFSLSLFIYLAGENDVDFALL